MTKHKWITHIFFYLFIVIIPSLLFCFFYIQYKSDQETEKIQQEAQRYAGFHAMNIDSFIGETIGRLETMAMMVQLQQGDLAHIGYLLDQTKMKDARFSGFYWTHPKGDILISTNPLPQNINLKDRDYFQEALKTQQTAISHAHLGRVTGRFIVSIATPVVHKDHVLGVLIGSVRLDVMQEFLSRSLDQEDVLVYDRSGQQLIEWGREKREATPILATAATGRVPWEVAIRLPSKDEKWFLHNFILALVISLVFTHILFILVQYDRLRRRLKLEQLQNDAQKMELIGSLAASTAHEIRNPLTGIKGLTTLLSERHKNEQDQFYFSVIQQEIDRINTIVSEFLVLGKPTVQVTKDINISDVLGELVPIMESEAHLFNVELSYTSTPAPLWVRCSKDHLKQVILNIAKNALEAMPNGGTLSIGMNQVKDQCILVITDTGDGIPEDVLKKIFHPFFTSKKHGTGLGLVICKRILEMYNGSITIHSTRGQGTKVEITLPLSSEQNS
ncbi:ATP-binding protein [Ammoniphilus sp. CFH 90114]|uniref:ATP-binding protein n=1 Tax=Ammoniphilus sp. CFH 90114 TaxID=2493665 RepID=UPI0013E92AD3|nr:ATP-binding protein [Ammoniphilus sp. CFH 90114]